MVMGILNMVMVWETQSNALHWQSEELHNRESIHLIQAIVDGKNESLVWHMLINVEWR